MDPVTVPTKPISVLELTVIEPSVLFVPALRWNFFTYFSTQHFIAVITSADISTSCIVVGAGAGAITPAEAGITEVLLHACMFSVLRHNKCGKTHPEISKKPTMYLWIVLNALAFLAVHLTVLGKLTALTSVL